MKNKQKKLLSQKGKIIEDLKNLIMMRVIFPEKYSVQDSERARRLQNKLKAIEMQIGRERAMAWRKLLKRK